MLQGLLLIFGVGILWSLLGVIMSKVASTGRSIFAFYTVALGLAALIAWIVIVDWSVLLRRGASRLPELVLWIGLAGGTNAAGQIFQITAMQRGHRGMTWGISQCAMMLPFLASILFWQEVIGGGGWAGIICVLCGIIFLVRGRDSVVEASYPLGWLALAILAFLSLGTFQILMSVPSRWPDWVDTARLRTPISLTVGMLIHISIMIAKGIRFDRRMVPFSAAWAICALFAYLGVFRCLDIMARLGLTAIVFPIGISTCIIAFSAYSHICLREPYTKTMIMGLSLAVIGIMLLTLR